MNQKIKKTLISLLLCVSMLLPYISNAYAETPHEQSDGTGVMVAAESPKPSYGEAPASEEQIESMYCPFSKTGTHVLGSVGGIFPHPNGKLVRGQMDERAYEASCTHGAGTSSVRPCQYCYTWFTVTVDDAENPAKNHSFKEVEEVKSNCDGATYKMKKCTVCGFVEVETDGNPDADQHKLREEIVTNNDCETDVCLKKVCDTCGIVFECTDNGPKGHSGVLTTIQNGNCRQNCIREFKCGRCTYSYRKEYQGDHIYAPSGDKATCTTAGTRKWICTVCGIEDLKRPEETIEALGHDWENVTVTCTEGTTQQCKRCGITQTVGSGLVNHDWDDEKEMAPTCTEAGFKYHTCKKCGIIEKTQEHTQDVIPHDFSITKVIIPATCGADGLSVKVCRYCGEQSDNFTVPATGKHTPKKDDGDCTTPIECSECGTITTEGKSEHDWSYKEIPSNQNATKEHTKSCKNCDVKVTEFCSGDDDGDCTTPIKCQYCGSIVKSGAWHVAGYEATREYIPVQDKMDEYHVALCSHTGCNQIVESTQEAHTYVDGTCTKCGHVHGKEHIPDGKYESDGVNHWQRCKLCGGKVNVQAHDKTETSEYDGDCSKAVKCTICDHVVRPAAQHNYSGKWEMTTEYHFRVCQNPGCNAEERYDHDPGEDDHDCTTPTVCQDCDYVLVEGGKHAMALADTGHTEAGHKLVCKNAGCRETQIESHTAGIAATCHSKAECQVCHTAFGNFDPNYHTGGQEIRNAKEATEQEKGYTGDIYCLGCKNMIQAGQDIEKLPSSHKHVYNAFEFDGTTHTPKCACGHLKTDERSEHVFGLYTEENDGHSRTCTVCGYVDSESHRHSDSTNDCTVSITCIDCGAVIVPGKASHNFAGKAEGLPEGHVRACINENCNVVSEPGPHIGGSSSCQSGAHCDICNYEYREKDSSVHTGGTELRDQKNPTTEENGYTGDIYCLGCGALIEKGESIEKLPQEHEHSFDGYFSDATHHWKMCQCGAREDEGEHDFRAGVCIVCGAVDPSYKELPKILVEAESGIIADFPDGEGEYYENIRLSVDKVEPSENSFDAVESTIGKIYKTYIPYDIRLIDTLTNNDVQPKSIITVNIPVPQGWAANKTLVFHVADGKMTPVPVNVSDDDAYVSFTVDHLSLYVLANAESEIEPQPQNPAEESPQDPTNPDTGDKGEYAVLATMILAALVGMTAVATGGRKKRAK